MKTETVVHDDGVIRETIRALTEADESRAVQLCYAAAAARGEVRASALARLFRRDALRLAYEATLVGTIRTGTRGDFDRIAVGYFVGATGGQQNLTGVLVTEHTGHELVCESEWGGDVAKLALRRAALAARTAPGSA